MSLKLWLFYVFLNFDLILFLQLSCAYRCWQCIKINGNVRPITGPAGTEWEYRYTFTRSLTLGLDDVSG